MVNGSWVGMVGVVMVGYWNGWLNSVVFRTLVCSRRLGDCVCEARDRGGSRRCSLTPHFFLLVIGDSQVREARARCQAQQA